MINKVEHIGIAVLDIQQASQNYKTLLGSPSYKVETVESEGVETMFFRVGETKIELLADISGKSVIKKFIEKKGEGIHHIAYSVDNLEKAIEYYCKEKQYTLIVNPKKGADNKVICFLKPQELNGVLVELCQDE